MKMARQNQYFPQTVPHPGRSLAEKLEEMGMGPKEFALRTGKPEKTIIAVLQGDSAITPDMAVQFEQVTRIPAGFWLRYQAGYDEYQARERRKATIEAAESWAARFPLSEMIRKGWLPPDTTRQERTNAVLSFFGFTVHHAWEDYYFRQQLKVAFRISLVHAKDPYALSAWLRQGELQAAALQASDYSERKFRDSLPEVKALMARHPSGMFEKLQAICLQAGVKVVHTPCIKSAPISGATRWLNDTPLIQLSGRYNRIDSFWFTFFHEAGHILLHGKKDIFLEQVDHSDEDLDKEREADAFAVRWTLPEQEEAEIVASARFDEESIKAFARKFMTHPAMIVGRLHHKRVLSQTKGRSFLQPVIFD